MTCIIPARGGSRRIHRKNIKDFKGRPMIAYAIEAARKADIFENIIVSTDDDEIASVSRNYGADVHYRKPELCLDNVGTQTLMGEVLKDLSNAGVHSVVSCCLYPCVPLLDPQDIAKAYDIMMEVNAAFIFSVGAHPQLHDAGQFYLGSTQAFIENYPLIDPATSMYPIPPERDVDINTMEDWNEALRKYDAIRGVYVN